MNKVIPFVMARTSVSVDVSDRQTPLRAGRAAGLAKLKKFSISTNPFIISHHES